ncbi:MAG: SpoIID/LytB domain-containing protein [Muribaculaceae bacterium]|nr:SpoIID/LytB domain-containing protein [Muribaculaceae bacterium]
MNEPKVKVGIMSTEDLNFSLFGNYMLEGQSVTGRFEATIVGGKLLCDGKSRDEFTFLSTSPDCYIELEDVVIGVNFHWERKENQRFRGDLRLIVENGKVTAINEVLVEDYLQSVISSEMSATASEEFLKAHAVISRSWLLAQIEKNREIIDADEDYQATTLTDTELVKWYDREDHTNFDVCADDHCQRYQGITRESTDTVRKVIEATRGLVLTSEGRLCDARFSKCCGGVYEEFQNCWEPRRFSYLVARADKPEAKDFPDLTIDENAVKWILSRPDAFCNTSDAEILSQVLNNYDQETTDFYRWRVDYTQDEISEIACRRSGINFGRIIDLVPLERGTSGRIVRLKVVGTNRTMIIGKELEIRRTLSNSHLYSSAFVVEKGAPDAEGVPASFTLRGAGWGHGVGLCQIGAAVMGAKGYKYDEILLHYFVGADITKLY